MLLLLVVSTCCCSWAFACVCDCNCDCVYFVVVDFVVDFSQTIASFLSLVYRGYHAFRWLGLAEIDVLVQGLCCKVVVAHVLFDVVNCFFWIEDGGRYYVSRFHYSPWTFLAKRDHDPDFVVDLKENHHGSRRGLYLWRVLFLCTGCWRCFHRLLGLALGLL